jgi:prepilin-type N-terminal cleavage/methylation domain-containing protein
MNKIKFRQFLLLRHKYSEKGISLTELLVALVISGIVLTAATSGFINLLKGDQSVQSKAARITALNKALGVIQDDIKGAKAVTRLSGGNCSGVDSSNCLVITYNTGVIFDNNNIVCNISSPQIIYGYENIATSSTSEWLKPGILKRKVFCTSTTGGNWEAVADGLISVDQNKPRDSFASDTAFCSQNLPTGFWPTGLYYGANSSGKGGFLFCLDTNDNDPATLPNNRLVRVFLYGHIIGAPAGNNLVSASTIAFARGN